MSALLLQTENLLSNAGMTVLIGIVVVFSVLLILTFIFWLFGKVAGSGAKTPVPEKPKPTITPAPVSAPIVEDGVPEEVVAVIAAAIAAMSDGTTRYAVRRISTARTQGTRPIWAAAGILQNTQPF